MTKVSKKASEAFAQLAPAVPTVVQDPIFLNSGWGAVPVFGHHLVSKKDLLILGACLSLPMFMKDSGEGMCYHGTKVVVFRDDGEPTRDGKPVFGNATPCCGGIAINLMRIVSAGIDEATNNPESSIRAGYHRNLIMTMLHEIHHLSVLKEIPKSKSLLATADKEADEWAYDMMMLMAQTIDIEPAHHSESPVLCKQLLELLAEKNDEWSKEQRHRLDNNIFYVSAETDEHKATPFKGYLHFMSGDERHDPKWNTETILGAGAESPLSVSIRMVDTITPTVEPQAVPQSAQATNTLSPSEYMEMEEDGGGADFADYENYGTAPQSMQSYAQAAQPVNQQYPVYTPPITSAPSAPPWTPATAPPPQYATAAQTQAEVAVYPATGLTKEGTGEVVVGLYRKIYDHIFGKCGRLLNSDLGFSNPEAVTLGIPLTEMEKKVVVKMDCLDPNGRWCPNMQTSGGLLFGSIMKNAKLPTFKIYVNENGFERVRMMLPQNSAKRDGSGNYTKPALQARAGSCIMYIMEGNDAVANATGKKFLLKIVDGVLMAC
jgi:hypothetical protein